MIELAGELHLLGYSFCGPGTNLHKRLDEAGNPKPWSRPNKHEILISPAMAYLAFYILFWEIFFKKLKKKKNPKLSQIPKNSPKNPKL